jgi:transcriptional regulator with XRE-family HTH domain
MQKTFIGTQLRQLRREKGQTQAEMARTLGVTAAYINLLEKKPTKPVSLNFDGLGRQLQRRLARCCDGQKRKSAF